jgi:VWFA-related protein
VIHEFTEDPQAIIDAAQRLSGIAAFGFDSRSGGRGGGGDLQTVREWLRIDHMGGGAPPEYTLHALEAVARHVNGVPGRKNLVWISAAFPISVGFSTGPMAAASRFALAGQGIHLSRDSTGPSPTMNEIDPKLKFYTGQLRQAAKALNDADLAVYPIDLGGLRTGGAPVAQWATMDEIAAETGGRAFYNTNDFEGSLRKAMDDARLTYTLGFYVPESDWDGKFHKLAVKVKAAGAELLSRRGYFAGDLPPESEADRTKALQLAVASPMEGVGIGVQVTVPEFPLQPGAREIVVTLAPSDLHFVNNEGRWHASVDMVFTQQRRNGQAIAGQRDNIAFSLFPESYERAQEDGLVYKRQVEIAPGASRLRIVVRDAATGAMGSFSLPVLPKKP